MGARMPRRCTLTGLSEGKPCPVCAALSHALDQEEAAICRGCFCSPVPCSHCPHGYYPISELPASPLKPCACLLGMVTSTVLPPEPLRPQTPAGEEEKPALALVPPPQSLTSSPPGGTSREAAPFLTSWGPSQH